LCDNRIADAGATALAEAMQTNSTVTELNLYGNVIGHAGAGVVPEAIYMEINSTI